MKISILYFYLIFTAIFLTTSQASFGNARKFTTLPYSDYKNSEVLPFYKKGTDTELGNFILSGDKTKILIVIKRRGLFSGYPNVYKYIWLFDFTTRIWSYSSYLDKVDFFNAKTEIEKVDTFYIRFSVKYLFDNGFLVEDIYEEEVNRIIQFLTKQGEERPFFYYDSDIHSHTIMGKRETIKNLYSAEVQPLIDEEANIHAHYVNFDYKGCGMTRGKIYNKDTIPENFPNTGDCKEKIPSKLFISW